MRSFGQEAANLIEVEDLGGLDRLFQTSYERPVVLYKHSSTCGVSSDAYREMSRYTGQAEMVVVQTAQDLSHAIETRTGIRHESPQVIVLRNGQPVWHASHWRITADAVRTAVEGAQ